MKLRYYLRGLGIGVLVTAFLMARLNAPVTLTDAQIKQRAAELGMVEQTYLSEIEPEEKQEPVPEQQPQENQETTEAELTEENLAEENLPEENLPKEETPTEEPETGTEETEQPEVTEPVREEPVVSSGENTPEAEETYIVITIERGNGSDTVSRKLFEAGLVDSAAEYDKYLMANGYDRRLSTGNHEIPTGATEEEIAKIICGQR